MLHYHSTPSYSCPCRIESEYHINSLFLSFSVTIRKKSPLLHLQSNIGAKSLLYTWILLICSLQTEIKLTRYLMLIFGLSWYNFCYNDYFFIDYFFIIRLTKNRCCSSTRPCTGYGVYKLTLIQLRIFIFLRKYFVFFQVYANHEYFYVQNSRILFSFLFASLVR